MRWTQAVLLTRVHAGVRRSRVVLTPRCWRQVARKYPRGDGGKQAGHRGERVISRKTIAQGRRNAPTVPVCSCAFSSCTFAHETAGAASTRRSLRPQLGGSIVNGSGALRGESVEARLDTVIASELDIVIASEAKQSISPRKERMDCFAEP